MFVNRIYWSLTILLLLIFGIGLFKNLGNIAFWGDEGETVQLGKSILQFGYPSVFDGRSTFLFVAERFNKDNYLVYNSPYLQHYIAALALKVNNQIADPYVIRFPFALIALSGILASIVLLFKQKVSSFAVVLYSFMVSTSVQLYLYYRQSRHYALHLPLALGFIYSYFYLNRRIAQISFIIFGFLLYNAFYPSFFAIYLSLLIHLIIRVFIYKQKNIFLPFLVCSLILSFLLIPIFVYTDQISILFDEQGQSTVFLQNMFGFFYDLNYHAYLKILYLSLSAILLITLVKSKIKHLQFLSFTSIPRNHWLFLTLLLILIPIYPAVMSLGRHNPRYVSLLFPIGFFLVAYFWDYILSIFSKSKKIKVIAQLLSIPLFFYLVLTSHPDFVSQLKFFKEELGTTFIGPVDGIVNTITGAPYGRTNPYVSARPDILIATNVESEALYAYLGSQFLDRESFGIYKYGTRKPDWIIPRRYEGQFNIYDDLTNSGDYEMIETNYCDTEFQQFYLVKTHYFKTVTDCPSRKLVLYKLKEL